MMNKYRLSLALLAGLSLAIPVAADSMEGSVKLGYAAVSGNADSESLAFASKLSVGGDQFSHLLTFDAFSGAQNGITSAERYTLAYKLNSKISDHHSAFMRLEYDDDRFSGFDYQAAATVGLTTQWQLPERHSLSTDLGVGLRSNQFAAGGSSDEAIVRLAAAYAWVLSDTTTFEQSLSAEIGEESTVSKSRSGLSVAMTDALSLAIALHYKHNSNPVAGAKSVDRETTVSLDYRF